MTESPLSTLIVHDYCQAGGGAERLVSVLRQDLPRSALWTSGLYEGYLESGINGDTEVEVLGSSLRFLPRQARALISFLLLGRRLPTAKNAIYSGIFAVLAAPAHSSRRRICYCHTTPQFAYGQQEKYRRLVSPFLRPFFTCLVALYRWAYRRAMGRMDLIITNSRHIQQRIHKDLQMESRVIFPPIDVDLFKWIDQSDFYLSLGRLEPRKRVDLVVKAFLHMPDKKLIVASGGSQLEMIKQIAAGAPNISVLGWVDDRRLADLVGRAIACLYLPVNEDFGMSAVEAMAAGKPVIAVNEGGLAETVIDGTTGYLLPPSFEVKDICEAVRTLDNKAALEMRSACESRSRSFSRASFIAQIRSALDE